MALDTETEISDLKHRSADERALQDPAGDISGGVEAVVGNVTSFTLFLDAAGATDVTVEFSPDGGTSWYEPRDESPISFSGANTEVVHVDYVVDRVRLTGSDTTSVKAQLREVV